MAKRRLEDYKWKPIEDPDPDYDTNTRMVTITMPEGMWEDMLGDASYATGSGEQTLGILANGGGSATAFMQDQLIDHYRSVAVKIVQLEEGEHGTVEYPRY